MPISDITLDDTFNGTPAGFTQPDPDVGNTSAVLTNTSGNSVDSTSGDDTWDVLAPGDVLTITTTYVVTQADVDGLQ